MRTFALLAMVACACGGGGDPQSFDLQPSSDLGGTADLAMPSLTDASMGMLLCTKYMPPNLPPFAGSVFRVTNQPDATSAPAPAGGAVVEGTYIVTSNISYGGGSGTSGGDLRMLLILEGGAWFYRIEFDSVDDMRFAGGFYTVDATAKTIVFGDRKCGGGGAPVSDPMGYSANGSTLKTYLDQLVGPSMTRIVKEITYTKQ